MPSVKPNITIRRYQAFVKEVYGLSNDRFFSLWDMIANIERFSMRAMKGIRLQNTKKAQINLLISTSWFMSLMNQLCIDLENEVWKRFPYVCSWCASLPCSCKKNRSERRRKTTPNNKKRPKTLEGFQRMFAEIYPPEVRTLEHAGIHLAEELGELSEALLTYRGNHKTTNFKKIPPEAADAFSCFMGVFNSLGVSYAKEISTMFSHNCHICKKAPCECSFEYIVGFKS